MKDEIPFPAPHTVSIKRAAQLLGVTRRTIYNYIDAGKLVTRRTFGGGQRVAIADLQADPRYRDVPPDGKGR